MTPTDVKEWQEGELTFREMVAQPYQDCVFSAGFVSGHPVDTVYLRWTRDDGSDAGGLLLRPDELAAIAWCCTGVLFSGLLGQHLQQTNEEA